MSDVQTAALQAMDARERLCIRIALLRQLVATGAPVDRPYSLHHQGHAEELARRLAELRCAVRIELDTPTGEERCRRLRELRELERR